MVKRFIVVDPSFTSHDGDRWQYAVDLARSSNERGYEFVLLTSKRAPSIRQAVGFPFKQRCIFEHAFYEHDKIYERHRAVGKSPSRHRNNLIRKDKIQKLEHDKHIAHSRSDYIEEQRIVYRLERLRRHTGSLQWLAEILEYKEVLRERPFNRDNFAQKLARELARLNPGPDDILFFHTMTYGMMESLSEVTAALKHRPPFDTHAYFLFHFGTEAPDARTFLDRYYSYAAYGSISDRMKVGSPFRHLHFLCTCEPLRVEAERVLNAPVAIWHGLVNPRYVDQTLGGLDSIRARRAFAQSELERGEVRILVRAADLDPDKARSVSRACHLAQHRGNVVRLRLIYHSGSFHNLREILNQIDFPNFELIETESNESYLREVCDAGIMLLTYDVEKYAKRVSAVLHDCAVLGVPTLVPSGTTLESCDYAPKFVYGPNEGIVGGLLNAIRYLQRHGRDFDMTARARALLAGNAVDRLLESAPKASIVRSAQPAPIANVVMPLWGRVGSSFAMEAQIRYLIGSGYFVNQIFLMDKPVAPLEATEYFWKMLLQNSLHARGSIQRIAFRTFSKNSRRLCRHYLQRGAFGQLLLRYVLNRTEDPNFDRQMRQANVSVVNHVFHSDWAFRFCGGRRILETHDIQSYQMVKWPLINEATGQPENISSLLREEMAAVARYDHVINVAPQEHAILCTANHRASLVTPYLPETKKNQRFKVVRDMAYALDLHESYRYLDHFDLLIVGDAHPANQESVLWFIREVFNPYLAEKAINLVLVGNISNAIYNVVGETPHLFYLGFVEDLEEVKSLSKLVILPDKRGTGISIKTLEAMASGMPFVATGIALRGLRDRLPADLPAYDEPIAMADAINAVIRRPDLLAGMAAVSRECYGRVAGKAQFSQAWDKILLEVLPAPRNRLEKSWRWIWRLIKVRWTGMQVMR
jgi:hypothetical protein